MKKTIVVLSAVALALTACENKKQQQEIENAQALAAATHEELVQAVNERDQLLDIINEITSTTEDIKQMEGIVAINKTDGEGAASSAQIESNISAIKATLEDRRKRLNELEESLKKSKTSNSKLLAAIEGLKKQVADQTVEIDDLRKKLSMADEQIAALGGKVDSLSTTVADVTTQRDSMQNVANEQELLANACYYAIGSKDELKANDIIEGGGFLKKQKLTLADANKAFFTQADKRTLKEIPLHTSKAKLVTSFQPKDSYQIVDVNGQKVLRIVNPAAFWSASNYLVIQID